MIDPVTDHASFERAFERVRDQAEEAFEKDKGHAFIFIAIRHDGRFQAINLGEVIDRLQQGAPSVRAAKAAAFRMLAFDCMTLGVVGYIQVSEIWGVTAPDDLPEERIPEWRQGLAEKYGPGLENVPGRFESLIVHGRYRDQFLAHEWRIHRRDDEATLITKVGTTSDVQVSRNSNMGEVDLAVDLVLSLMGGGKPT